MFELYFEYFTKKVSLTAEERQVIANRLSYKTLQKKELLLQQGEVCTAIAFVEKGLLRAFSVDENGAEHIIQFAPEGWHTADLYSFLTQEKAVYTIEALEDVTLTTITKENHELLLIESRKYEAFTRELITNAYVALQRRLNASVSLSLEERYQNFMKKYNDIANRVPQHMIASYMGLTPETLSRVRKRIATKK